MDPNVADASTLVFAYDALNRKTSMSDSIGTVTYTYDAIGNLVAEDGPFANDTLYYDYTPDRQLAAITSSFYKVEYAYDNLGRLSTVIGAEGTNTYAYAAAGTLWTNLTLAKGTTAERQFDALLRLTNLVNRADVGVLSSFALTLDDADQRTQVIREDGKVYTYAYDAIGQLTNASAALPDDTPWPGYQFSYTYDATGNPVEQNKNGLVYSNSFNNLNQNVDTVPSGTLTVLGTYSSPLAATITVNNVQAQLHDADWVATSIPFTQGTNLLLTTIQDLAGRSSSSTSTVVVSDRTYAYDPNGNMTTNGAFTYVWDAENRLTEVWQNGTLVQENRYDALWRRRKKVEYAPDGTVTTNRYIYKDWLVLVITDSLGNILETYTHGADFSGEVGGGAGGIGGILSGNVASNSIFYHYDFNGNILNTTVLNQSLLVTFTDSPFGEILQSRKGAYMRYQFSTKENMPLYSMFYYGHRFYMPSIGRFLNRDPLGHASFRILISDVSSKGMNTLHHDDLMQGIQGGIAETVNPYYFVMNNPISKWDYLGLDDTFGHKGRCCNDSSEDEWVLVSEDNKCAKWEKISPGKCVGNIFGKKDCEGMTCGGGFYRVPGWLVGGGNCSTPGCDSWPFQNMRWTPEQKDRSANSPMERAACPDQGDTPPDYKYTPRPCDCGAGK